MMEPLLTEFPIARSDSAMIIRDGQLMLWGGYTQTILGEGDDRFIVAINIPDTDSHDRSVEVFDLATMEWEQQQTFGASFPVFGKGGFSAAVRDHLYIFGGLDDDDYRNDLYGLNLEDFTWKQLSNVDAPSARSYGGMVAHGECVIVLGGIGKRAFQPSSRGAEELRDDKFDGPFTSGWNNSIHEYNTVTDKWRELGCTGSRPPPLERFSFDKIDSCRALLFGGKRGLFSESSHDIYILDLETMAWEGPFGPSFADQPWPVARGVHATACLVDPESELAVSHQEIAVFWGDGKDAIHLSDAWILHVQNRTWKKLRIPFLIPRKYHMCASHYVGEGQTDVIVYGGNKRRKSKYERNVMTDMIIFRFGSVRDLQDICVRNIKKMDNYEQLLPLLPFSLRQKLEGETNLEYSILYPTEFMGSV